MQRSSLYVSSSSPHPVFHIAGVTEQRLEFVVALGTAPVAIAHGLPGPIKVPTFSSGSSKASSLITPGENVLAAMPNARKSVSGKVAGRARLERVRLAFVTFYFDVILMLPGLSQIISCL